MTYESTPTYEYIPDPDQQTTLDYPIQAEDILKPVSERPTTALGDLVLFTVMGGVFAGAGVMPQSEAIVLEALSTTTAISERLATQY